VPDDTEPLGRAVAPELTAETEAANVAPALDTPVVPVAAELAAVISVGTTVGPVETLPAVPVTSVIETAGEGAAVLDPPVAGGAT
jgi:hypothetical protein